MHVRHRMLRCRTCLTYDIVGIIRCRTSDVRHRTSARIQMMAAIRVRPAQRPLPSRVSQDAQSPGRQADIRGFAGPPGGGPQSPRLRKPLRSPEIAISESRPRTERGSHGPDSESAAAAGPTAARRIERSAACRTQGSSWRGARGRRPAPRASRPQANAAPRAPHPRAPQASPGS
jgi:hypothetical protein